jgi:serine/threonine protein kinase
MKALGTSQELIREVTAKVANASHMGGYSSATQGERSTVMGHLDSTQTHHSDPSEDDFPPKDFDELKQCHQAVTGDEPLSWQSHYRKGRKIGSSAQGIVYLVECLNDFAGEELETRALKIFSFEPYGNKESYYQDMERMKRVAYLIEQYRNDNLVEVQGFRKRNGIYMMVMNLIDGYDVKQLLQPSLLKKLRESVGEWRWAELAKIVFAMHGDRLCAMKPGMAAHIAEQILQGAGALHEQKIIHGDIKPSNMMLDITGSVRLIDYGSAFELTSQPTHHMLTPRYVDPEILAGDAWTPQSDLASIGYVLIELISHRPNWLGFYATDSSRAMDATTKRKLFEAKNNCRSSCPNCYRSATKDPRH